MPHYCIPGNLSNDLIVDFSIAEYRSNLEAESDSFQKVHVFSVKLHDKMSELQNSSKDCFGIYRDVHTWAQNVDLKEKEYLLFPISGNTHFYLIAYVQILTALSESTSRKTLAENDPIPCILVFDSIKKKKEKYKEVIDKLNHFLLFKYMIQEFSMQDWCCGLVSNDILLERPSDRIQFSIRIRQLGIDYKEWKRMNLVTLQCELVVNKTNPCLGGQIRNKIRKVCNYIPQKIVNLVSEDEVDESCIDIDRKTQELHYVKGNFDSTFIPSICPSLVDVSVKEYNKNENKKKKPRHVEIDYNSLEIDTRPGSF